MTLASTRRDWFPIKDPIVVPVYVDLPPEARKKYREMERDMLTHIGGHDIEAFAASGKGDQVSSWQWSVYTGSDEQIERDVSHWVEAHEESSTRWVDHRRERRRADFVAYHFKPDLARLKKRFPHGRHINTKADEDAFKRGEIRLAFVHPQSIGHGSTASRTCATSSSLRPVLRLGSARPDHRRIGPMRQMQAGLDREVLVYQIIARDTIDEAVAERLVEKRGVLDATMDALALKPENING